NENEYSFDSHGEYPRPSIMPEISVGGKHLSSRSADIKIEKHTAVQDVSIGNKMAAWYTQEFLPDGVDYKLSKKANIYIGDFISGVEKNIYKGECYGDLCFYENDLFFNIGNKVAVYHIESGETEVLFKHSGIKKSGLSLHVTPKRIFFQHWTHSNNNTMWYDRETKEVINPHFDGRGMVYLDDETIVYHGLDHTWRYDVANMKKKRFFSNKEENSIIDMVAEFFDIPKEYIPNYHSVWSHIRLEKMEDERLYFECSLSYDDKLSFEEKERKCYGLGLPTALITRISCDFHARNIKIEADKNDIKRYEEPFHKLLSGRSLDFPCVTMRTFERKR
ncbi:MAG: hypothetical protein IKK91_04750, partial [Ruminococcus sp.]|nr:hypothetical protein [Ruminococcus sp.]